MKKKIEEVKDYVLESENVEETKEEKKSLKRFIKPALIFGGGLLLGGLLLGRGSEDECEDDEDSEEVSYDYYDVEEEAQREIALKIENGDMKIEDLEDTVN